MVSTRMIAKKCNVSLGTVSRVLNNKHNVNEETRKLVLDAIKELNYDPLAVVPAVRQQADITYGLVLPHLNPGVQSEFLNRAVAQFFNLGVDPARIRRVLIPMKQLVTLMVEKNSDPRTMFGVGRMMIFSPGGKKISLVLEALRSWKIPTVLLNRTTDIPGVPVIHGTEPQGMLQALDHLYDLGHRQLALINGSTPFFEKRTARFHQYLEQRNLPASGDRVLKLPVRESDTPLETWVPAMHRSHGISAFMCCGDEFAARTVNTLMENGIDVPGRVSVVGYNNDGIACLVRPQLTTVDMPVEKMVEAGFMLLKNVDEWNHEEKMEMVIPHSLVIRSSTGPVR